MQDKAVHKGATERNLRQCLEQLKIYIGYTLKKSYFTAMAPITFVVIVKSRQIMFKYGYPYKNQTQLHSNKYIRQPDN